jgi:putative transposase
MSAIPFYIQYGIQGEENAKYFVEVRGEIIGILKQSEAGAKTSELCRQHGISTATFYGWRSKYGGLEVSEAKRLKQLEEENAKLKRIVADQALDITMLKDLVGKKW